MDHRPADLGERAQRAAATLRERFGDADADADDGPIRVAAAPGRVNLVGGHTDYNDGFVLPVAIDRHTLVAGRRRSADDSNGPSRGNRVRVRAHATAFAETREFRVGDDPGGWASYVAGVAHHLAPALDDFPAADLVVAGGVPMGAGLSSSAALEVGVGRVLVALAGRDVDRAALADVCWRAETSFVGLDCGVMDQYAVACCAPGAALFLDCRDRTAEAVPFDADEVSVVVVDTTIRHELVDSAYNDRVAECARGAALLGERLDDPVDSLRDVSVGAFEANEDALPDPVRGRVRHVVRENERVRVAAEALGRSAFDRVGEAMLASHRSLRDDYAVSCAELDAVVDVAAAVEGVFGARMTGGGFGGSVVCLARRDAVEDLVAAVQSAVPERVGVDPEVYVCEAVGGVELVE